MIRPQALDPFGTRFAICNMLHGAVALFNEDMAAALCRAVNDWVAKELLDREPRLRASILVPLHNPEAAVAEIERVAADRRFVQVLLFAMGEILLGRRILWPVYAAAEKHGLPIGIHAGGTYQPCADRVRLALVPGRGLHRPIGRVRGAAGQSPGRGRVPPVPHA